MPRPPKKWATVDAKAIVDGILQRLIEGDSVPALEEYIDWPVGQREEDHEEIVYAVDELLQGLREYL